MKMSHIEKALVNSSRHSRHVARRAVERLRALPIRRGQRYLDVGCGNGVAAMAVAEVYGLQVTGLDVDPEQVRAAQNASLGIDGVTFCPGDATHLPFPDASFDIVATNKMTHHIPRWREVLGDMARVVAPGGHLVYADLTVPTSIARLLRPLVGRSVGIVTRRDLDRCVQALGLDAVQISMSWSHYDAVFRKPRIEAVASGRRRTVAPVAGVAFGATP